MQRQLDREVLAYVVQPAEEARSCPSLGPAPGTGGSSDSSPSVAPWSGSACAWKRAAAPGCMGDEIHAVFRSGQEGPARHSAGGCSMTTLTATVTLNAAFFQEIKEDNQRLQEL